MCSFTMILRILRLTSYKPTEWWDAYWHWFLAIAKVSPRMICLTCALLLTDRSPPSFLLLEFVLGFVYLFDLVLFSTSLSSQWGRRQRDVRDAPYPCCALELPYASSSSPPPSYSSATEVEAKALSKKRLEYLLLSSPLSALLMIKISENGSHFDSLVYSRLITLLTLYLHTSRFPRDHRMLSSLSRIYSLLVGEVITLRYSSHT